MFSVLSCQVAARLPTIVRQLLIELQQDREALGIGITSALPKEKSCVLSFVDGLESVLKYGNLILFEEKKASTDLGESATNEERVMRGDKSREAWVPLAIGLNYKRVSSTTTPSLLLTRT